MNDLHIRKFLSVAGPANGELRIYDRDHEPPSFAVEFNLNDETGKLASFFWAFWDHFDEKENLKSFTECAKFFEFLRKVADEGLDELTSRWLTLKESENADPKSYFEEGQEDYLEESDCFNRRGAEGLMQEESSIDHETEGDWLINEPEERE